MNEAIEKNHALSLPKIHTVAKPAIHRVVSVKQVVQYEYCMKKRFHGQISLEKHRVNVKVKQVWFCLTTVSVYF